MTENKANPVTMTLEVEDATALPSLLGNQDKNIVLLENTLDVIIHSRGTHIEIKGSFKSLRVIL